MPARLLTACLVATVFASGCGAIALDRLDGEPASTHHLTRPLTERVHPAVDGCQRFVLAIQTGDAEAAWAQLSSQTRKALHDRAKSANLRGVDLLRLRKLPVGEGEAGTVPFDPLRVFVVPQVKTLQVVATPEDATVSQRLELTDASGAKRQVTLRFENFAWRLHHPELSVPATP